MSLIAGTMNSTDVEKQRCANGFQGIPTDAFSQDFKDILLLCIRKTRMLMLHVCRADFEHDENRPEHPKHAGIRFHDDHVVLIRALSGIMTYYPDLTTYESVEGIEREYTVIWAWEALSDAAQSDHWYTYEKEWS